MNRDNNRVILVTGATGLQGGATARHLLSQGWAVRGLTRHPNSPAARTIAEMGVEVVPGDLEDRASLDAALEGAYGVYSFPNMAQGIEGEIRQGKLMADAAQAAGVEHFIQGSVGGVERDSGIPHFESKWQVEEYVRGLGLPATFLRPAYFMDNLAWKREQILNGTYESLGMRPDKPLQMIAVDDIGAFAALAFENPQDYMGQGIELAGDELTEPQMVGVLAKVLGRPIEIVPPGPAPYEDMGMMVSWFNETGFQADIPALRKQYPALMTLESWLRKNGWAG